MSRIKRRILLRRKVTRFSLDRNTFSSLAGKRSRSVSASIGSNTKMSNRKIFRLFPRISNSYENFFPLSLSFFSIILSLSSYICRIEIFDKCIDEMEFFFFLNETFDSIRGIRINSSSSRARKRHLLLDAYQDSRLATIQHPLSVIILARNVLQRQTYTNYQSRTSFRQYFEPPLTGR